MTMSRINNCDDDVGALVFASWDELKCSLSWAISAKRKAFLGVGFAAHARARLLLQ
jgi:hypothetical protein